MRRASVCPKIKQDENIAEFSWLGNSPGSYQSTQYAEYCAYDTVDKYNIHQAENYIDDDTSIEIDDDIAYGTDYGQW